MLRAAGIAVVVLAGAGRAASGQSSATLDAGGSHLSYEGAPDASVVTLTPALRLEGAARSLDAYASLSRFDGGTWSIQGSLDGSVFTREIAHLRAEVGGRGGVSGYGGESATGTMAAAVRLHLAGETTGLWAGGEAGRGWNGSTGVAVRDFELGVWARRSNLTVLASATPTAIGGGARYVDLQSVARFQRGRLELGGFLGLRTWNRPSGAPSHTWGGATLLAWVGTRTALTVGAGSYAADYAQGFPAGRYVTVAMRFATRRPTSRQALFEISPRLVPPLARPVVAALETRRDADNRVHFLIQAVGAARVELMGDFTNWDAIPLTRSAGDRWEVILTVPTGTYRMNLRVDGREWGVPPGVPVLRDEFGGVVGVLTLR